MERRFLAQPRAGVPVHGTLQALARLREGKQRVAQPPAAGAQPRGWNLPWTPRRRSRSTWV